MRKWEKWGVGKIRETEEETKRAQTEGRQITGDGWRDKERDADLDSSHPGQSGNVCPLSFWFSRHDSCSQFFNYRPHQSHVSGMTSETSVVINSTSVRVDPNICPYRHIVWMLSFTNMCDLFLSYSICHKIILWFQADDCWWCILTCCSRFHGCSFLILT